MDWLFVPEMRAVPGSSRTPMNEMVQNISEAYPNGKLEFFAAPDAAYLCNVAYVMNEGKRWYVFVNPYTGEVQGANTLTFQRFFRDLHYFLFIPLQIGHFTVLVFGFLLFVSLITALMFYKKWYKKLFELKRGKGRVVFYRSLHRLIGVWSVPFMILFSVTGIWYFLERTNTADISKISNTRSPKLEKPIKDSLYFDRLSYSIDYDKAIEMAQLVIPGLMVKDVVPPATMNGVIYMNGKSSVPLVRNRANRVYIHPQTYKVLKVQKAEDIGATMWLNDIADPLHFGYWGGLATKIVWFFGGLGISTLILTGLWIGFKRKVKNVQKQKAQKMGIWKYINWVIFGVILFFMYYFLIVRYHVSSEVLTFITVSLTIFILLGWYLFDFKIKKVVRKELTGS